MEKNPQIIQVLTSLSTQPNTIKGWGMSTLVSQAKDMF